MTDLRWGLDVGVRGIVYSSSCRAYPLGYGRPTALGHPLLWQRNGLFRFQSCLPIQYSVISATPYNTIKIVLKNPISVDFLYLRTLILNHDHYLS